MKLLTFKEKIWKSYNESRNLGTTYQILLNDINNIRKSLIDKMCFLKVNIDRLPEVLKLNTLFIIIDVRINSKGRLILVMQKVIQNPNDNNDTVNDLYKIVGLGDIVIAPNNMLSVAWFVRAARKALNVPSGVKIAHSHFKNILNSCGTNTNIGYDGTILVILITKKMVSNLDTESISITTNRNTLHINGMSNDEDYGYIDNYTFNIFQICKPIISISDLTFMNRYQINPLGKGETLETISMKMLGNPF